MNGMDIFEALGDVNENYIRQAEIEGNVDKGRFPRAGWCSIAVTAGILLLIVLLKQFWDNGKESPKLVEGKPGQGIEEGDRSAEYARWYEATFGPYHVFEINAIDDADAIKLEGEQYVRCLVEMEAWYPDEAGAERIEELYILESDVEEFRNVEKLFVQIDKICRLNGTVYYGIRGGECWTPIEDNRLIITDGFKMSWTYSLLEEYNRAVEWYIEAGKEGSLQSVELDSNLFYDGMSVEEMECFFQALKKAKKNYEEFLDASPDGWRKERQDM